MFDRIFNTRSPERVHVDISMPRPDAAEAMRLANELRREAEKSVAHTVVRRFGCNNYVRVVECSMDKNLEKDIGRARVKFTINDELYDTELFDLDSGKAVTSREALQQAIVEQVMHEVIRVLGRKL